MWFLKSKGYRFKPHSAEWLFKQREIKKPVRDFDIKPRKRWWRWWHLRWQRRRWWWRKLRRGTTEAQKSAATSTTTKKTPLRRWWQLNGDYDTQHENLDDDINSGDENLAHKMAMILITLAAIMITFKRSRTITKAIVKIMLPQRLAGDLLVFGEDPTMNLV